jgi:ArsR family transcriptional regulator, arsenate/arsenite/antimonite-responsive transcriptional repressor
MNSIRPDGLGCSSGGTPYRPALDEPTAQSLATDLKALADPVRLRLLSLLAAAADGKLCACALSDPVGRSQPTVSYHLKALRDAGLVTADRQGSWIWYSLRRDRLDELWNLLNTATRGAPSWTQMPLQFRSAEPADDVA